MPIPDDLTRSAADPSATTGTSLTPTSAPFATPASAGRYELGGEIARGGMGIVYRATDTAFGREVAVKVLSERYGPDSAAARRFADEARITGQLQHPAIPPAHDIGTLPDGRPFLAMKLIKGDTLDERLKRRATPAGDRGRFLAAFEQVCQALAYAHSKRVIHRDLKPANVMVGSFGEVQVMDWGLAKILGNRAADPDDPEATAGTTDVRGLRDSDGSFTQAGSVLGTPAFMPPEQALGLVGKVDERSDVFGLGAVLAVILTGRPPFAASSAETTRLQAARGDVGECFARLDGCGADPDFVALCKRCLAAKPEDRPADAGEVAKAVAGLRAAADERARQAELERVRVEGEKAAAEARSAEQRKRRRVMFGAAAVLALAVLGGLGAVLLVQRRANDDLEAKNGELADEQVKVEARFDLARKAIATFHTGVSEDALLKHEQFKDLRDRLLREAAKFYAELEKLLEGQSDAKSRRALAAGYYHLGVLTEKIGDKTEALAVHRKALEVRRELAAADRADPETRLDVALSLNAVGVLLNATGDREGALAAYDEGRELCERLAEERADENVHHVLASSRLSAGNLLIETGKPAEALAAYEAALAIRQKLADDKPDDPERQLNLAVAHNAIGFLFSKTGRPTEALAAHRRALPIQQRLADDKPADTNRQERLGWSLNTVGDLLAATGEPREAMAAYEKALDVCQSLADSNPAVTRYQVDLAWGRILFGNLLMDLGKHARARSEYESARTLLQQQAEANPSDTLTRKRLADSHHSIGLILSQTGKPAEALAEFGKARAIRQCLADANPTVTGYQNDLSHSHRCIGAVFMGTGKSAEALAEFGKALAIRQRLADANPDVTDYQSNLAWILNDTGFQLAAMGKPGEALECYGKALPVRRRLADANPTIAEFQNDLAVTYYNIGNGLVAAGRHGEALPEYEKALAIFQRLADAHPAVPRYWTGLSVTHVALSREHANTGRRREAASSLREATAALDKIPSPSAGQLYDKACCQALLAGLAAREGSGLTASDGRATADSAMLTLTRAVAAGYRNHAHMARDTDLDPLRGRDDFKKLMTDLEAKSPPEREAVLPPRVVE
jgi:tetratricopeptide (TPR) repeat protein